MIQVIYTSRCFQAFLRHRRRRRVDFMLSKVNCHSDLCILDIGCGKDGRSLADYLPSTYQITGIDLHEPDEVSVSHPNFTYYKQNAVDLSRFKDKQFDLAVSVGMMEHICHQETLRKMASEIDRVAKQFVIVVPWRYGWIEPHFKLPLFPLYPKGMQRYLAKAWNLNGYRNAIIANPNAIDSGLQWFNTRKWTSIFRGSNAYVCPTLETIAIVRRA